MKPPPSLPSLQGKLAKRIKPTQKPIVAVSERKQNLFWVCRTEQQSAKLNFAKEPFSPSRSKTDTKQILL